jgi:hypothetical protein
MIVEALAIYLFGCVIMCVICILMPPTEKRLIQMQSDWKENFDKVITLNECRKKVFNIAVVGSWLSIIVFTIVALKEIKWK